MLDNAGARAGRRAGLRHGRQLPDLAADRRRRPRDRPRQRVAHAAFDIHTLDWDEELLELSACRARILPGSCPRPASRPRPTLLGRPIPIAGVAGDQQAAHVRPGVLRAGQGEEHLRDRRFLLLNTGDAAGRRRRLLTAVAWQRRRARRLRARGLGLHRRRGRPVAARRARAHPRCGRRRGARATVADTGGVYLVPAFTGLGAPYWDPDARGPIVGLDPRHRPAHIARATLEAIAFQVARRARGDGRRGVGGLRVDGGASANGLLLQFQADMLGVPVEGAVRARDDGARRRLPRRPRGRLLVGGRTRSRANWALDRAGSTCRFVQADRRGIRCSTAGARRSPGRCCPARSGGGRRTRPAATYRPAGEAPPSSRLLELVLSSSRAAMRLTSACSSGATSVTPAPVRPARPVRPTRWT